MDKKKRKSRGDDAMSTRFSAEGARERAEIRRNYHECLTQLNTSHQSADQYGVIRSVTEKADKLITDKFVTPKEMSLDARVVKKTAKVFATMFEGMNFGSQAGGKKFNHEDYAIKLCHKMVGTRWNEKSTARSVPEPEDWITFSKTAARPFTSPMTADGRPNYLQNLGIYFSDGTTEPPVTPTRKKTPKKTVAAAQRPQGPAPKPTRMQELKSKEVEGDDQNMRRRMEVCRKALKDALRANGDQPVHYLKFVADPTSYENTVRNMFTVSFLINRLEVSLYFDKEDQPHIFFEKDKNRIKRTDDGGDELFVGNWIASITPAEWTQILDTYNIRQPMIQAGNSEDSISD